MNRRVLIVGAGIAGQTMSCALAMNGVMPDLVEIKSDWDILGAGMYVQSNALRGFAEIGIADKITAAGWHSRAGAATITNAQGEILAKTTIPSNGNPALSGFSPISRPVLHEILQQATVAAGVEVQMGKTVSDLRLNANDVHVVFTDGTAADYDLVVGADGIHSKVRSLVFDSVEPEYSGFSNWRVILPKPQSLDTTIWQMGLEKSIGIIPISHDKLYIAGVSKEPGNPWFERENMLELMRARFADFGGLAGELMTQVRDPDQIVYTPINEIIKPLPWVKGQVALVGDAAHASTPFWAQGAAMAVEDVVLLAQLLKRSDPIKTILAEWQQRRYERCAFVQEGSKRTGVQGHAPGEEAMLKVHAYIRANAQSDLDARYSRLNQPI